MSHVAKSHQRGRGRSRLLEDAATSLSLDQETTANPATSRTSGSGQDAIAVETAPPHPAPNIVGDRKAIGKLLLSIQQFGELTGVGRTRIYELLKRKELAAVKVGRRTYIRATDAEAWLKRLPEYRSERQVVVATVSSVKAAT